MLNCLINIYSLATTKLQLLCLKETLSLLDFHCFIRKKIINTKPECNKRMARNIHYNRAVEVKYEKHKSIKIIKN